MAELVLVDDDAQLRALTTRLLEQAGHSVRQAADGFEALKLLASAPCDLLLTDLYMPGMDGLELLQACMEQFPALPLIALSGGDQQGELYALAVADHLGALVTVSKPYRTQDLLAAVQQCLDAAAGRD